VWKSLFRRLLWLPIAAAASGILVVLALPPSNVALLGWFALVPVFLVARETRFLFGFVAGVLASLVAGYVASHGWFYGAGSNDGDSTWTYLGCSLFGVVFAIVSGAASEMRRRSIRNLIGLSAAAVLVESLLLFVLPAPFELSQSRTSLMLILASITGIWGIGFALWLVNLLLCEAIARSDEDHLDTIALANESPNWVRSGQIAGSRIFRETLRTRPGRLCVVLSFGLLMGLGNAVKLPHDNKESVIVGVVQSDATELKTLQDLSLECARHGAKLVVWPEFSGLMHVRNGNSSILRDLSRSKGMPPFVTSFRDGATPLPHNAASVFSSLGESRRYFKRKLFASEKQMHAPGEEPVCVATPIGLMGLNICYDSCFPSIIRDTARLGPDIVALPTVDPGSPNGFFAANHAAFSSIRSAEEGVSLIRADGCAYSTITDPYGSIVGQLDTRADRWAVGRIPLHGHWTIYKWAGDWFLYFCGVIVVWVLVTGRMAKTSRVVGIRE